MIKKSFIISCISAVALSLDDIMEVKNEDETKLAEIMAQVKADTYLEVYGASQ